MSVYNRRLFYTLHPRNITKPPAEAPSPNFTSENPFSIFQGIPEINQTRQTNHHFHIRGIFCQEGKYQISLNSYHFKNKLLQSLIRSETSFITTNISTILHAIRNSFPLCIRKRLQGKDNVLHIE
jgi:hypothetical protein